MPDAVACCAIVGAVDDVFRELREKLWRRKRVRASHHFLDRHPVQMPRVDLVLVISDMVGHGLSDWALAEARRLEIPAVVTQRKWSFVDRDLEARFFARLAT